MALAVAGLDGSRIMTGRAAEGQTGADQLIRWARRGQDGEFGSAAGQDRAGLRAGDAEQEGFFTYERVALRAVDDHAAYSSERLALLRRVSN